MNYKRPAQRRKLGPIFALLFIIYMLFIVGKTVYKNYTLNKKVSNLQNEINSLEEENNTLKNKILYYQTESFKEKEARQRLGLQKPGEEVIVLTPEEEQNQKQEEEKPKEPNYKKWWKFFFS